MQSRRDAVLKKIIMDRKLSVKARRTALADMQAPSRAFLARLANDPDAPDHVRLDATRRRAEVEHRMAGERVARARQRAEQRIGTDEEARRREIDEVLRQAAEELGINLDDKGGSKSIPESVARTHPEPEQPAVRIPDSPDVRADSKREQLLAQGRALVAAINAQFGMMSQAPLNWHAGQKKLEQLQADFAAFERAINADHPEIDTQKEFPDERLRFFPRIVDERGYFAQRRAATIDEQSFIAPRRERTKFAHDDGLWAVAGPGI